MHVLESAGLSHLQPRAFSYILSPQPQQEASRCPATRLTQLPLLAYSPGPHQLTSSGPR